MIEISRTLFFLGWLFLLIEGCSWWGVQDPPAWIVSTSQVYPIEQFLTGLGQGTSREQAEQRAYAAVARIFSANIQAKSIDQESYSMQGSESRSQTQHTLALEQRTQVTTNKVLENVKVLNSWAQPAGRKFFVLAGLNRQQAEQAILDRLGEWDETIQAMVLQGRSHFQKIQRIRGYKEAIGLLTNRNQLNDDLRIIRSSGKTQPPPYQLTSIQREFQEFVAKEVVIRVAMKGENIEEIERAILEGLEREGLLGNADSMMIDSRTRHEDLLIVGQVQLWQIDLPDPLFKYVRWCGDLEVYEKPSGQLIGVIAESGREGHLTVSEARTRAHGAMQDILGVKVARLLTHSLFNQNATKALRPENPQACPR